MARERNALSRFASQLIELAERMEETSTGVATAPLYEREGDELNHVNIARALLEQRRTRKEFLPPTLFHEPAWEILLSLFIAHEEGRTLNVKHLVQLIDAPITTSQRWIDQLANMRMIDRVNDPEDRRRLKLALSSQGFEMMIQYLRSLVTQQTRTVALNK